MIYVIVLVLVIGAVLYYRLAVAMARSLDDDPYGLKDTRK